MQFLREKRRRAQLIAQRLADTPFVRLLALGNSVAMGTATELSDLDFFVVTASNRLWTARFLLLLKAKWLGLAKRPGKLADQADFGFWVDETALDLSPIALRVGSTPGESVPTPGENPSRVDDPYLSAWLATLIPLVDAGGVYERLMQVNRELIQRRTVILRPLAEESQRSFAQLRMTSIVEWLLGSWLGNLLEFVLFLIQRWKVWRDPMAHRADPLTVNGRRVDVVTTPHMLKLHHVDQRAKVRERWRRLDHRE